MSANTHQCDGRRWSPVVGNKLMKYSIIGLALVSSSSMVHSLDNDVTASQTTRNGESIKTRGLQMPADDTEWPTQSPTTPFPTFGPTISEAPTSSQETLSPTSTNTESSSLAPVSAPTSSQPTTSNPTQSNTESSSLAPVSNAPTSSQPITSNPTQSNTESSSLAPVSNAPTSSQPTTSNPTQSNAESSSLAPVSNAPTSSQPTTPNPTQSSPSSSVVSTSTPTTPDATTPSPAPKPTLQQSSGLNINNYCGKSWEDAYNTCSLACPSGDSECEPLGEEYSCQELTMCNERLANGDVVPNPTPPPVPEESEVQEPVNIAFPDCPPEYSSTKTDYSLGNLVAYPTSDESTHDVYECQGENCNAGPNHAPKTEDGQLSWTLVGTCTPSADTGTAATVGPTQGTVGVTEAPDGNADDKSPVWWLRNDQNGPQCVYGVSYPDRYMTDEELMEKFVFDSEDACCAKYPAVCGEAPESDEGDKSPVWWLRNDQNGTQCVYGVSYPDRYMTDEDLMERFVFDSEDTCCAKYPTVCGLGVTPSPTPSPVVNTTVTPTETPTYMQNTEFPTDSSAVSAGQSIFLGIASFCIALLL